MSTTNESRKPWDDEPDRIAWVDDATGMDCLIKRGPVGALCGYVAVEPGHPAHAMDYDADVLGGIEVHGGLTYASKCTGKPGEGICHTPRPGHAEDVWWLGFDCAHVGDLVPGLRPPVRVFLEGTDVDEYRDVAYVRAEVHSLARQLAAMAVAS